MLTRAVFSEGDAARPTPVSQPPGRAHGKTSKHYRSRLARPLFFKPVHSQVAIVRQSLADVRLAPESTDQIVRGREPAEVGHSLQVPDDEAWLHAGRSVAQCLGVEKEGNL